MAEQCYQGNGAQDNQGNSPEEGEQLLVEVGFSFISNFLTVPIKEDDHKAPGEGQPNHKVKDIEYIT